MKADILTLKSLFQKDVRYVIPPFQRPYVWTQEEQWEPLWNDVRNTAERYLEELKGAEDLDRAGAETRAGKHFLGAVVLQQRPTPAAEIEARDVIDGQQRLTTLQLVLDAAQEVFETDGIAGDAKLLKKFVLNDEDVTAGDSAKLFKITPTLVDQTPFVRAMQNGLATDDYADSLIVQAHEFFQLQIREWLASRPDAAHGAHGLATALVGLLQMVVIDLDQGDDANIIFETLNARGTPLQASDLIKNSVLHDVQQLGWKQEDFYRKHWRDFDERWWREEIQQGRIVRPRLDVFANYWLAMRTGEEVLSHQVFPGFRKYVEAGRSVVDVVDDLTTAGRHFRRMEAPAEGWAPEQNFLYRWHVMEAGVSTPVVLWLFSNADAMGPQAFHRALQALESYLVRRTVCRMTTKDYSRLFQDLMAKLNATGPENAAEVVIGHLRDQSADSRFWPSDAVLRSELLHLPLYRLLTRRRMRMVLEAIEDELRGPKTEEAHVARGTLTVEHLMPQAWVQHWPLSFEPGVDEQEARDQRDRLVHSIGNLTLVNKALNPSLSNGPWDDKTKGLAEHSVLRLNQRLLDAAPETWDEAAIRTRSDWMAGLMARIWPGAAAL